MRWRIELMPEDDTAGTGYVEIKLLLYFEGMALQVPELRVVERKAV